MENGIMASHTDLATARYQTVGMGQIAVGQDKDRLVAILGSCIGLTLHHERLKLGILAHIVLPYSNGQEANPGKFADTAIPYMLDLFEQHEIKPIGLTAKLVGGARMFGTIGPMQIGKVNADTIIRTLDAMHIRVKNKDIGGTNGRRISFDCSTGKITVETIGHMSHII